MCPVASQSSSEHSRRVQVWNTLTTKLVYQHLSCDTSCAQCGARQSKVKVNAPPFGTFWNYQSQSLFEERQLSHRKSSPHDKQSSEETDGEGSHHTNIPIELQAQAERNIPSAMYIIEPCFDICKILGSNCKALFRGHLPSVLHFLGGHILFPSFP